MKQSSLAALRLVKVAVWLVAATSGCSEDPPAGARQGGASGMFSNPIPGNQIGGSSGSAGTSAIRGWPVRQRPLPRGRASADRGCTSMIANSAEGTVS